MQNIFMNFLTLSYCQILSNIIYYIQMCYHFSFCKIKDYYYSFYPYFDLTNKGSIFQVTKCQNNSIRIPFLYLIMIKALSRL